ncbi:PIN domain-containing protein [Flavobacterium sp. SM2513]|uniref:PIN domain-containing protein n=1 Tax=Flavobacterium sp. SM2513 TaxID=3424766 RepID=UPI003D7FE0E5
MIVITDSNILFSALKSPNGTVAKILTSKSKIQFYAPNYLIEEIKRHSGKISDRKQDVLNRLEILLEKVEIIDVAAIPKDKVLQAIEIVKDIDIDDAFFVALHLFKKHKIWTSDKALVKGLESKGYKICVTTSELKLKLYKK